MSQLFITTQGTVSTSIGLLYQPTSGYTGHTQGISINHNSGLAFTVSISRFTALPTPTIVLLYTIVCSAGDFIEDGERYHLNDGDSIYGVADVSDVNYVINGTEISVIPTPP